MSVTTTIKVYEWYDNTRARSNLIHIHISATADRISMQARAKFITTTWRWNLLLLAFKSDQICSWLHSNLIVGSWDMNASIEQSTRYSNSKVKHDWILYLPIFNDYKTMSMSVLIVILCVCALFYFILFYFCVVVLIEWFCESDDECVPFYKRGLHFLSPFVEWYVKIPFYKRGHIL